MDAVELRNLPDVRGIKVVHLCCNCGQDTLSLANLGAICTGFDVSLDAILHARTLSKESGVFAEFVECNVLSIPEYPKDTQEGILGENCRKFYKIHE